MKFIDPTGYAPKQSYENIAKLIDSASRVNEDFSMYWDVRGELGSIAQF
ncbi:hypothetical protein [Paenibacillus turpanensis]|nr:hypothetical protein [Paenibacillus turpanensis]